MDFSFSQFPLDVIYNKESRLYLTVAVIWSHCTLCAQISQGQSAPGFLEIIFPPNPSYFPACPMCGLRNSEPQHAHLTGCHAAASSTTALPREQPPGQSHPPVLWRKDTLDRVPVLARIVFSRNQRAQAQTWKSKESLMQNHFSVPSQTCLPLPFTADSQSYCHCF